MSNAEKIRSSLRSLRRRRRRLERSRSVALDELSELLEASREVMPLSEAAELAGISRFTAYELLKRSVLSDSEGFEE